MATFPPKLSPAFEMPSQCHWLSGWQNWSVTKARTIAQQMRADNARGVVFHLQPKHVVPVRTTTQPLIDEFRRVGINKVYLDVYVNNLGTGEQADHLKFWQRGDWDGMFCDAENHSGIEGVLSWQQFATQNRAQALANMAEWMDTLRPLVPLLGLCSFPSPNSRPGIRWGAWNKYIDVHIPQVYHGIFGDSIDKAPEPWLEQLNYTRNSFRSAEVNQEWANTSVWGAGATTSKPIITLRNAWGAESPVQVDRNLEYANIALARYTHIHWWRVGVIYAYWPPLMSDVFRALPAIPPGTPPPDPDPPPPVVPPWDPCL